MTGQGPTPPVPLPEGEGEKSASELSRELGAFGATPAVAPLPAGREVGGGNRRRKVALAIAVLLLVAGGVWYFAIRAAGPRDDVGRLQGDWKLAPDGKEGRLPVIVRVSGDRWVYVIGGQEGKAYRLTLRPEAEPKELDLTQLGPDGQPTPFVLTGIYAFDEGGVRVLVAPGGQPRPAAFDAPERPPVWVLERP